MSYINLRCKTCSGNMSLDLSSKNISCSHCGRNYIISDLLDDKDIKLISKMSSEELSGKINANSLIKEGESYIYQANFKKAEQSFKKAIEFDELNFKAYLGVVRAKTHNLNIIPDEDDYKEYARQAYALADADDKIYVKSELLKLGLLSFEKKQQEKQLKTEMKKHNANVAKKKYEGLFGKIASAVVIAIAAIIILLIVIQ